MHCLNCLSAVSADKQHKTWFKEGSIYVERKPSLILPGAFAICFHCGVIGQYDQDMNIAPLSKKELSQLDMEDPHAGAGLAHLRKLIKQRIQLN